MPEYGDPSSERLGNGRSMSDLMRRGPGGLKGVVIAPSTTGGTPQNFDPHNRDAIAIHVEPDGANSQLTLRQMTAEHVNKALAAANSQVSGSDINSIRERAAVAFEELAKISKSVQRVPAKTASAPTRTKLAQPAPQPVAAIEDEVDDILPDLEAEVRALRAMAPPVEKIDRNYSPMAAFGLKKSTTPHPTTATPAITKSPTIGPPQKLVYFEKEGIGTVPAFFHDVLVHVSRPEPDSPEESGFLVFIYDLRFEQNAARWFPPSNDPYGRPWAVQINEDSRLYLVHTTGFQYVYDSREYCVLLVERAVRAQPDE